MTDLKVHEVEELVDLRGQDLHRLLVDLHPVRLLVRLQHTKLADFLAGLFFSVSLFLSLSQLICFVQKK